ncbi:hypothetical protein SteCoe_34349 [Stentor coeruleus]|uniref:PPIase cyclophilin-type domain-containing protein n=1 Tax=Stentor coeruleus TaxID=5963 RepID=A0A1R2AUP0_9CILI|nr:hypothetical protein SteCoe_34349 [Stentor coeruleus]
MSNRYVLEPPTSGKVILRTTHGEIHIELWTREAPLACRNFIQLCMEGYFDNTPFYRVILGFMVQVGPETSNESIYGGPFKDEFHSRLKFAHRGIVAMANSKSNDNKSHFFITVDKAPYLDRKNTIFGKVPNNTIYNVIRISEAEVDHNDRPLMLPQIISTEIIINPFDDIIPREKISTISNPISQTSTKIPKAKVIISYDNDDDLDDDFKPVSIKAIKSSHDTLDDTCLSKDLAEIQQALETKTHQHKKQRNEILDSGSDEDFDLKMKKQVLAQKDIFVEDQPASLNIGDYKVSFKPGKTIITKVNAEKEFDDLKKNLQLKFKKKPLGTNNPMIEKEIQEETTFLSPLQKIKYNFYQHNKKTKGREKETLSKLDDFVGKIKQTQDKKDWLSNRLKFSVDSTRAFAFNKELPSKIVNNDDDDRIVVDPTKRLKKFNEDQISSLNSLEQALSIENLMKISSPQNK